MVNLFIKNQLYCMGESVLDKRGYNRDLANQRVEIRQQTETAEAFQRVTVRSMQNTVAQQSTFRQSLLQPLQAFTGFIRGIVAPLASFFGAGTGLLTSLPRVATALQKLTEPVQQGLAKLAAQLANMTNLPGLAGQIASVFFGAPKENDKVEEREKRDANERGMLDLDGELAVKGTQGSAMNSGGG